MNSTVKEYSNGEVTIVWQPKLCIHSENCVHGLPGVFNLKQKPWINAQGASSNDIKQQIDKCPSGALSYYMNSEKEQNNEINKSSETKIELLLDGPLMVYGEHTMLNSDGSETVHTRNKAYCRCGASSNKPYCDGTHKKIDFKG